MQGFGSMTDWNDLRYFLALYRARTLAAAARALNVDATTAGRRLAALEERLGARLFDRTPDGLRPTEEAARVLEAAEGMEALLLHFERETTGADGRIEGTVRLTTAENLAQHFIIPRLAELRVRHPDLEIDLRPDPRTLDLTRREADVAIRLYRPEGDSLITRKLGTIDNALYAADSYLARKGTPATPAALADHDFIGYPEPLASTAELEWMRKLRGGDRFVFRTTSTRALAAACAAGLGIGVLPCLVGSVYPGLRRLLPAHFPTPAREIWVAVHRDVNRARRVRVLVDFLVEVFTREARLLSGYNAH
jgi:DNA-binding transcriptional LysR family regulator